MSAAKIAHLFVDASNLNVYPDQICALHAIACENFTTFYSAVVVGSNAGPSKKPAMWRNLGYMVKFVERNCPKCSQRRLESEFNVDDVIAGSMFRDIARVQDPESMPSDRRTCAASADSAAAAAAAAATAAAASLISRADHVMVLLSGDGNDNNGWPSLLEAIEQVQYRPAITSLAT